MKEIWILEMPFFVCYYFCVPHKKSLDISRNFKKLIVKRYGLFSKSWCGGINLLEIFGERLLQLIFLLIFISHIQENEKKKIELQISQIFKNSWWFWVFQNKCIILTPIIKSRCIWHFYTIEFQNLQFFELK